MGRIHVCKACQNEIHGIKTRIAVPHTCDKGSILDDKEFNEWMDRCNMRGGSVPLHIRYKMYKNQSKK